MPLLTIIKEGMRRMKIWKLDCRTIQMPDNKYCTMESNQDLRVLANNLEESFQNYFFRIMREKGLTAPIVYKNAGISKVRFCQMMKDDYLPHKENILRLGKGALLNEDEMRMLLTKAGYASDDLETNTSNCFVNAWLNKIEERGMSINEICDLMEVHKSTVSRLKSNQNRKPEKETVMRLCIGANLNFEETHDMLIRAGYVLSPSIKRDVIIAYYLKKENYGINELNEALKLCELASVNGADNAEDESEY